MGGCASHRLLKDHRLMSNLRIALDRTLLLMRDDVASETSDELLLAALTSTTVALVANTADLSTHSAQVAFTTTALLLARSGHRIRLLAPDVPIIVPLAPLASMGIVSGLMALNGKILPTNSFVEDKWDELEAPIDLSVIFGSSRCYPTSSVTLAVNAGRWTAQLTAPSELNSWPRDCTWPFGAMTAAVLVAAEAFKISMRKLRRFARNLELYDLQFAPSIGTRFELAPAGTPTCQDIGRFDVISGGAISHAALYCLSRIPDVEGRARVVEFDKSDFTNLNRYMFLLTSDIPSPKEKQLSALSLGHLRVEGINGKFELPCDALLGRLAQNVLVGVDHIPTRWDAQIANPAWLGIGATTHWSAMASFHEPGLPCARCAHNVDDPTAGRIPTVAFVSFFSGLLLASYFVRRIAGEQIPRDDQQIFLTAIRAELPVRSAVSFRRNCPICSHPKWVPPLA